MDSDIVDTDMLDTAYAPDEIPPHTDGTYMTQSPGYASYFHSVVFDYGLACRSSMFSATLAKAVTIRS